MCAAIVESDFRLLVRLLGQVCLMRQPRSVRRVAVLEGLCPMIGATGWGWGIAAVEPGTDGEWLWRAGSLPRHGHDILAAGPTPPQNGAQRPVGAPRPPAVLTRIAAGGPSQAASIVSTATLGDDRVSVLQLLRDAGQPPFGERELELVRLLCEHVHWLHQRDVPAAEPSPGRQLSPRLQQVLAAVREGRSRHEIAEQLGLSPYTVRDYMSQLYRHFAVRSQPELMQMLRAGPPGGEGAVVSSTLFAS